MNAALDVLTVSPILAGGFFFLAGTVGLLRFPDTLTRLHALTKADNLGLGLVVVGLLPQVGSVMARVQAHRRLGARAPGLGDRIPAHRARGPAPGVAHMAA